MNVVRGVGRKKKSSGAADCEKQEEPALTEVQSGEQGKETVNEVEDVKEEGKEKDGKSDEIKKEERVKERKKTRWKGE